MTQAIKVAIVEVESFATVWVVVDKSSERENFVQ